MKTDKPSMRIIITVVVLFLSGCADLGYYWHSAKGHMDVMNRRVAIEDLLEDPGTSVQLKQRLALVKEIRAFAFNRLHLPESGSYSDYAQLDNPYVLQNLFAAPEFSTKLLSWCYPIAGCTSYRGFFEQQRLDAFVTGLKADDNEVHISRVPAYSTLGWFDDPVLSSFINWPDHRLAGLLFHELTHQRIYIDNDTKFNESLASAVQQVGIRLWLEHKNQLALLEKYNRGLVYRRDVARLIESARDQLDEIYNTEQTDDWKRQQKQQVFQTLRDDYEAISRRHDYRDGYARWMAADLNNAKLGSVSTYNALIPAFVSMISALDYDFERFYQYAEKLGGQNKEKRDRCLQAWQAGNASSHSACP